MMEGKKIESPPAASARKSIKLSWSGSRHALPFLSVSGLNVHCKIINSLNFLCYVLDINHDNII